MLACDFYPEGHQGGVGVIQNGERVATNGDIGLNPTPGQCDPIPKVGKRVVDKKTGTFSVHMAYTNEAIDRKGFTPVDFRQQVYYNGLKPLLQYESSRWLSRKVSNL